MPHTMSRNEIIQEMQELQMRSTARLRRLKQVQVIFNALTEEQNEDVARERELAAQLQLMANNNGAIH